MGAVSGRLGRVLEIVRERIVERGVVFRYLNGTGLVSELGCWESMPSTHTEAVYY